MYSVKTVGQWPVGCRNNAKNGINVMAKWQTTTTATANDGIIPCFILALFPALFQFQPLVHSYSLSRPPQPHRQTHRIAAAIIFHKIFLATQPAQNFPSKRSQHIQIGPSFFLGLFHTLLTVLGIISLNIANFSRANFPPVFCNTVLLVL